MIIIITTTTTTTTVYLHNPFLKCSHNSSLCSITMPTVLEDNEAECIQRQQLRDCGPDSLGTTHCGFAKITFWLSFSILSAVYKGCINCTGNRKGHVQFTIFALPTVDLIHYGFGSHLHG